MKEHVCIYLVTVLISFQICEFSLLKNPQHQSNHFHDLEVSGNAEKKKERRLIEEMSVEDLKKYENHRKPEKSLTPEEMDALLKNIHPSMICEHKVDPITIEKVPGTQELLLLGKGGFGSVYKAKWKPNNKSPEEPVAVKYLNYKGTNAMSIFKEINYLKKFSKSKYSMGFKKCYWENPNEGIVKFEFPKIIIVTLLADTDGEKVKKDKKRYAELLGSWIKQATLFKKIAIGIQEMHNVEVIHRDLKEENIFFDAKGEPIIGDLGLCIPDKGTLEEKGFGGTPYYIAPEMVKDRQYDRSVDIYSLGVTFYGFVSNEDPTKFAISSHLWPGDLNLSLVKMTHLETRSPLFPIIQEMTLQDPSKRPKIQEVIDRLEAIIKDKKNVEELEKYLNQKMAALLLAQKVMWKKAIDEGISLLKTYTSGPEQKVAKAVASLKKNYVTVQSNSWYKTAVKSMPENNMKEALASIKALKDQLVID